jgi:PD-(D/E)XK nuclease superfamily
MHEIIPFPHAIDSTTLAAFRSCPQKAFRTYFQHYKPLGESVHLVAGKAFAEGIEFARRAFYEQNLSPDDSIASGLAALINSYGDFQCPPESAKSLERTAGALEFYFQSYPLGVDSATPLQFPDGRSGIEFSFAQPLPINHPITGDPLLYTGRADMIAHFAGGVYIYDEKTTSQLGASWGKQWEMRSQFTGYCWAAREFGYNPSGVIVRGVSILKTKYDTLEVPTYRSDYEIDRWLRQVCEDLDRMMWAWKRGYWDYNLDHSCAEYGGCSLLQVCKSPNPDQWLETYFERRVWDPLARREVTWQEYTESRKDDLAVTEAWLSANV